jgi:hypothetical protein
MYEKLDRLRAEVERCKKRIEDDRAKLRAAEERLREAENNQILADVGAMHLSPEQLAQFLKMVSLKGPVPDGNPVKDDGNEEEDYEESEDSDDEDN